MRTVLAVLLGFAILGNLAAAEQKRKKPQGGWSYPPVLDGAHAEVYKTVGDVSAANGFVDSLIIRGDRTETGVGGGVCQVASTVFVAALLSGLTVVERHRHSFPVDYIERGEDATIAWGAKDLRVANDSDQPLRLRPEMLVRTGPDGPFPILRENEFAKGFGG